MGQKFSFGFGTVHFPNFGKKSRVFPKFALDKWFTLFNLAGIYRIGNRCFFSGQIGIVIEIDFTFFDSVGIDS